jgi:hypothetical protein
VLSAAPLRRLSPQTNKSPACPGIQAPLLDDPVEALEASVRDVLGNATRMAGHQVSTVRAGRIASSRWASAAALWSHAWSSAECELMLH